MKTVTVFRIHVQGQIRGLVSDDYEHTYEVSQKPSNMEEVRKIAGDFESIKRCFVEEVTTTSNMVKLA